MQFRGAAQMSSTQFLLYQLRFSLFATFFTNSWRLLLLLLVSLLLLLSTIF